MQCQWNGSRCAGIGLGWNDSELLLGTYDDGVHNARSFLSFDYAPLYGNYVRTRPSCGCGRPMP